MIVFRRVTLMSSFVALVASASWAQDHRVELAAVAGWTLSDGVTFSGVQAGDGNIYNSIEPKDAFSYGFNLGFLVTPNVELGFLFNQQKSTLDVGGTAARTIGDMNVDNYHGYLAYNFGDENAKARFYVLGGLGATHYAGVSYSVAGVSGTTQGSSLFSSTWGAGVKLYPNPKVGLKLGVRWTPTYIKSDAVGWWCDPYWGCYVVADAQYSNQVEFSGGLVLRF